MASEEAIVLTPDPLLEGDVQRGELGPSETELRASSFFQG